MKINEQLLIRVIPMIQAGLVGIVFALVLLVALTFSGRIDPIDLIAVVGIPIGLFLLVWIVLLVWRIIQFLFYLAFGPWLDQTLRSADYDYVMRSGTALALHNDLFAVHKARLEPVQDCRQNRH